MFNFRSIIFNLRDFKTTFYSFIKCLRMPRTRSSQIMASQQHVGLMPWQECWEIIRGTFITVNAAAGFHAINKGNDQLTFLVGSFSCNHFNSAWTTVKCYLWSIFIDILLFCSYTNEKEVVTTSQSSLRSY